MSKQSAGLLLFRRRNQKTEVLLVHPGGPFWASKDFGAWSIPKGEFADDEDPLAAARREFKEETGFDAEGTFTPLTPLRQPSGKLIHAWAVEGDLDARAVRSNTFPLEWPPHSGIVREYPEVDRAAWFTTVEARRRVIKGQAGFIDDLEDLMERPGIRNGQGQKPSPK